MIDEPRVCALFRRAFFTISGDRLTRLLDRVRDCHLKSIGEACWPIDPMLS